MSMPDNLVFVRHGQSEANIVQKASKEGDNSYYTDDVMTVPDRSWRLTKLGIAQANESGKYLTELFPSGFDRYFVSPYTRTRETAAHLNIPNALWRENRVVRERFWGEIGTIPRSQFLEDWPLSAKLKVHDPLYWSPPGGESIAEVADSRVHGLLGTLHRENSKENVIVVSHGEFIRAAMLTIERWSDEEYVARETDPGSMIHNGMIVHYTRINPETGERASRLEWIRIAYPQQVNTAEGATGWGMRVIPWRFFDRQELTNQGLLEVVHSHPNRLGG